MSTTISSSGIVDGKKLGRVTLLVPKLPGSSFVVLDMLTISDEAFMVDSSTSSDFVVVGLVDDGEVLKPKMVGLGLAVVVTKMNKFGRNIPENPVDMVRPVVMSVGGLPSVLVVDMILVVAVDLVANVVAIGSSIP